MQYIAHILIRTEGCGVSRVHASTDSCWPEKSIVASLGLEKRMRISAARLKKIVPMIASSQALLMDNRLFNPRVSSRIS